VLAQEDHATHVASLERAVNKHIVEQHQPEGIERSHIAYDFEFFKDDEGKKKARLTVAYVFPILVIKDNAPVHRDWISEIYCENHKIANFYLLPHTYHIDQFNDVSMCNSVEKPARPASLIQNRAYKSTPLTKLWPRALRNNSKI